MLKSRGRSSRAKSEAVSQQIDEGQVAAEGIMRVGNSRVLQAFFYISLGRSPDGYKGMRRRAVVFTSVGIPLASGVRMY